MKTFLIVDGNAIMHRAYHALPPLTANNGEQINAVYGFFSMLLKVIEDRKPDYVTVCFDRPKPTFRKTLYAGYQANRPQMADGLSTQFVIVHNALEQSHISIFEVDGYEADDLIGTLAYQAVSGSKSEKTHAQKTINEDQIEVIILSGDRDMLQLVTAQVKVLMPITGISKMIVHDEKSVEEKYGVKPSQFIDYKALIGDASDGYPGVSGIGPKTAANLLKKFQTFESLYQHLADTSATIAEKLATDAEQASLAKKLATIVTDAPITLHLQDCSISRSTKEDFYHAWNDLGFDSLRKRLDSMQAIVSKPKEDEQLPLL